MENKTRFRIKAIERNPKIEKISIIIVAKLGVTRILIKHLAIRCTRGLKIDLKRQRDGMFDFKKFLVKYLIFSDIL